MLRTSKNKDMVAGTIWVAVAVFIFIIILYITCSDGSNRRKNNDSKQTNVDSTISPLINSGHCVSSINRVLEEKYDFCEDNHNLPEATV